MLVLEAWEHRRGPRAPRSSAEVARRRVHRRRPPHHRSLAGRRRALSCMEIALQDAGLDARRHPPDQRPRHLHPAQRRGRGRGHARSSSAPPARRSRRSRASPGTRSAPPGPSRRSPCVESMRRSSIPPTAVTTEVDPELPAIDLVMGEARPWEPGPTISNSFGFGGHNGSVVSRRGLTLVTDAAALPIDVLPPAPVSSSSSELLRRRARLGVSARVAGGTSPATRTSSPALPGRPTLPGVLDRSSRWPRSGAVALLLHEPLRGQAAALRRHRRGAVPSPGAPRRHARDLEVEMGRLLGPHGQGPRSGDRGRQESPARPTSCYVIADA